MPAVSPHLKNLLCSLDSTYEGGYVQSSVFCDAVGELWLISGQSNVALSLGDLQQFAVSPFNQHAGSWISEASRYSKLRLFKVRRSTTPSAMP